MDCIKEISEKKCTSMKRSKALIFRIKCINKLLPTKDLCYQRDPVMYKSKTCIACFTKEELLEHLAECCIYQKIWEKIEGIILEELDLRLNKKWNLTNTSQRLKAILLGMNTKDKLDKKKLLIRGLTSIGLIAEVKEVIESGSKANKVIC